MRLSDAERESEHEIAARVNTDEMASLVSGADSSSDLEVRKMGIGIKSFQILSSSACFAVDAGDAAARQDAEHEAGDEPGGKGARLDRAGGPGAVAGNHATRE